MKQWYTITFAAKLDQDDIKAMNKCFYDAMNESMEISECANLTIKPEYDEKAAAIWRDYSRTYEDQEAAVDTLLNEFITKAAA